MRQVILTLGARARAVDVVVGDGGTVAASSLETSARTAFGLGDATPFRMVAGGNRNLCDARPLLVAACGTGPVVVDLRVVGVGGKGGLKRLIRRQYGGEYKKGNYGAYVEIACCLFFVNSGSLQG